MILSIPFEEIKTFPKEVRLFLNSYFKKKLSESLKEENQVFLNQTSTLNKTPDILGAPIFTRHPTRKLIANNKFDWFKFLSNLYHMCSTHVLLQTRRSGGGEGSAEYVDRPRGFFGLIS